MSAQRVHTAHHGATMASVYKTPSGWRVQVRIKGKPTLSKIFPRHNQAIAWGREQEELLHKNSTPDPHLTYSQLFEKYSEFQRPPGRTKENVLKRLGEYWGEWRMIEIGTRAITDWAKMRKRDGAGPATVLQELSYFGTVISHGAVLCESEEANRARAAITSAIKTLRAAGIAGDSQERDRRPTAAELERLEHWFADRPRSTLPMMDIVLFAICTAMRLGEIVGPKGVVWEDFDEQNRTIWVRGRKDTAKGRGIDDCIPLLRGVVSHRGEIVDPVEIMMRQKGAFRRRGRIFPYSISTVSNCFADASSNCGAEDLHFHDLRHDAISRLFEAGFEIPQVAAVSGHRTWKHLARYTHMRPESLHKKFAQYTITPGN